MANDDPAKNGVGGVASPPREEPVTDREQHDETEEGDKTQQDKTEAVSKPPPLASHVDVHPLVLLSLVDHYARMNSKALQSKRVVGILLGRYKRDEKGVQTLDINNSFAVPFDEDPHNLDVWFFDTNYAEAMLTMYRRVMPQIRIVGWYSSGPTIQPNDMLLHLLVANRFCVNPVYCVVNTDPNNKGVPVLAYTTVQGREGTRSLEFRSIATRLGAEEAEEIGIEHLLRDLTDSTVTTLSNKIEERELSMVHMTRIMRQIEEYLGDVAEGRVPLSEDVLDALQELISLQQEVHLQKSSPEMVRHANDQAISTFLAAIARCICALHEVILNRRVLARELAEISNNSDHATTAKLNHEKHKVEEAEKEAASKKINTDASAEAEQDESPNTPK